MLCTGEKNNLGKALECFNLALAISEKVMGAEHIGTAVAAHNLAGVLQRCGEPQMALLHFEKTVAVLRKQKSDIGEDHPFLSYAEESLRRCRGAAAGL